MWIKCVLKIKESSHTRKLLVCAIPEKVVGSLLHITQYSVLWDRKMHHVSMVDTYLFIQIAIVSITALIYIY